MRICALMENTAKEGLAAAHGLSVYVETEKHRILVDAGPDWNFLANASRLNIDLSLVDLVFLSHGHYDHAGGLSEFMRINDHAVIYAAEGFDLPHYDRNGKYIGVEPLLSGHPRVKVLSGDLQIDSEVRILASKGRERLYDAGNNGMSEGGYDGARVWPETFAHEHYLVVGDVLFSGCSHAGIVNIAEWGKPCGVRTIVGGFHFMDVKPEEFSSLDGIAGQLLASGMKFYTGHCTGLAQYEYLKGIMGRALDYLKAGDDICLN